MAKKKTAPNVFSKNGFKLKEIESKTANQAKMFDCYSKGNHLFVSGCPGTGKSFLACYLAIKEIISQGPYKKLLIVRSVVQSRDIGYLPGTLEEKAAIYEAPYVTIFAELFGRADAYDVLKEVGVIDFVTTSFLRGLTFNDSIVLMDENQNATFEELNTVISRIGENSKIVFMGDFFQNDLTKKKTDKSGYYKFRHILETLAEFSFIDMNVDDIVRSKLAKNYIIARIEYEKNHPE